MNSRFTFVYSVKCIKVASGSYETFPVRIFPKLVWSVTTILPSPCTVFGTMLLVYPLLRCILYWHYPHNEAAYFQTCFHSARESGPPPPCPH